MQFHVISISCLYDLSSVVDTVKHSLLNMYHVVADKSLKTTENLETIMPKSWCG